MVYNKIADIKSKGVNYVISGDAGCLMNISGAMEKMNLEIKGVHLYDFIAQRINLQ